ncbi:MAG: acyl-[acyl-carrier-protein]--UDP-N-acetylglucosamine O-acyltransferase [Acidobacteria bacterium]|nr:MAG: acyl-[acyl-carrier-protein]--UDP-N-acetylglucosamine O-acyltransferase [Acidobacteriota bacterium]
MIHPTAIVSPEARMASDIFIGPYCRIGGRVHIGRGCRFDSHVVVEGPTTIGDNNHFFPFGTVGLPPQDLKFEGEETFLTIGSHNVFREFVNIHRGTKGGGGHTKIGDHNLLMVYVHVAHDCIVGSHVILANAATLGGHVTIEDHATIGAFSGVHPFCRIGTHGYVGGYSVITKDVLPYSKTASERNTRAFGVNTIGLERKGFTSEQINNIKAAFRLLLQSKLNTSQAVEKIRDKVQAPEVQVLLDFIETSTRGVIK